MQKPEIVVDHLVKRYGARSAVRDVSFSIGQGEIIGLLGPNGSGKSTIMRILTGYLLPSAGTARVDGLDVAADSLAVRQRVGYVPEDAPLYDGMRVGEFLRFMAQIKGISGIAARAALMRCSEQLGLGPVIGLPIAQLSRGYRQRVAIAQALLSDPPVLILDEPTNALDAYHVIGVRELIRAMAGRRTVLVASHVLSEIERIAARIMILVNGKLLTADAMQDAGSGRRLRLRASGPAPAVLGALRQVTGVLAADLEAIAPATLLTSEDDKAYLIEVSPEAQVAADIARAIAQGSFALSELVEVKPDLERVFLDLTRRSVEAEAAAA